MSSSGRGNVLSSASVSGICSVIGWTELDNADIGSSVFDGIDVVVSRLPMIFSSVPSCVPDGCDSIGKVVSLLAVPSVGSSSVCRFGDTVTLVALFLEVTPPIGAPVVLNRLVVDLQLHPSSFSQSAGVESVLKFSGQTFLVKVSKLVLNVGQCPNCGA